MSLLTAWTLVVAIIDHCKRRIGWARHVVALVHRHGQHDRICLTHLKASAQKSDVQFAATSEYIRLLLTSRASIPSLFMRSRRVLRLTPNRDAAPLGPLTRPLVSLRILTILSCSLNLPTTSAAVIAPFVVSEKETASVLPLVRITDRSTRFSNSRTFPGQHQRSSFCIVVAGTAPIRFPIVRAYFCVKCCTSNGMSSRRSRNGGIRIGNTFNR